jgi:hypothetical protein
MYWQVHVSNQYQIWPFDDLATFVHWPDRVEDKREFQSYLRSKSLLLLRPLLILVQQLGRGRMSICISRTTTTTTAAKPQPRADRVDMVKPRVEQGRLGKH